MRINRTQFLALAAAVLATVPAAAQQQPQRKALVLGQVIDARTGEPVRHAAVYLENDRTVTVADSAGRFVLKRVRPGTRALWADAPGYTMDLAMLEVAGDTARVTLEMQSDPIRLATLNVSTSRLDRRMRGYAGTTRVFRERDLAGMWYNNVLEMVRFRGGVRPSSCPGGGGFGAVARTGVLGGLGVAYNGGFDSVNCIFSRGTEYGSRVYVDEALWAGGLGALADFQLPEVARVEVYGNGREVHVYTRNFMDWVSRRPYVPTPIGLGM